MAFQSGSDYFTGLVYIKDRSLLPLQTVLREILATLQVDKSGDYMQTMSDNAADMAEAMRIANVAKILVLIVVGYRTSCYSVWIYAEIF